MHYMCMYMYLGYNFFTLKLQDIEPDHDGESATELRLLFKEVTNFPSVKDELVKFTQY